MTTSTTTSAVEAVEESIASYPPAQHSPADLVTNPSGTETTDTPVRFLAYAARFRTLAIAGSRYLAYTSDVGEAFRPLLNKTLVNAAYGVSFAYVGFDVAFEGMKARQAGLEDKEVARVVVQRSVFQGLASLFLPAVTIHTVVDVTGKLLKNRPKTTMVRWGPTVAGLVVVPFLPVMFDHPVEHLVERAFKTVWPSAIPDNDKEKSH